MIDDLKWKCETHVSVISTEAGGRGEKSGQRIGETATQFARSHRCGARFLDSLRSLEMTKVVAPLGMIERLSSCHAGADVVGIIGTFEFCILAPQG